MMGRVTQGMMNTQLLRNLNGNLNRMTDYQNQMATTKKINKPSDDPVGMSYSLRYRSELNANDQYQENVDSAVSWMEFTDTMLNQANNVLHRVRELTVQAANGSNSETSMDAIQKEVAQLTGQLITIGNTRFNGKNIFNGQNTDILPYAEKVAQDPVTGLYTVSAKDSKTDDGEINFEIATGVKLPINMTGNKVFGVYKPPAPVDPAAPPGPPVEDKDNSVFNVMEDLMNALGKNNGPEVSKILGRLDERMNTFLEMRADVGAKLNRVQLADERLKDININLQSLQSKTEDADLAELITNMKTAENVYQASLSVGSKIISASLVDFLR
jgi:flagellar hook-associated protein 3 FlgL